MLCTETEVSYEVRILLANMKQMKQNEIRILIIVLSDIQVMQVVNCIEWKTCVLNLLGLEVYCELS